MSADKVKVEGIVTNLSRGIYTVETEHGQVVRARLSGKIRHNKINVYEGDWVHIEFSPYDLETGMIVYRSVKKA